jgi:hypothetical protein
MTINDLIERLVTLVTSVVEDLRMETADGSAARAPVVIAGMVGPPRSATEQRPPFIVVRPMNGSDDQDDSRCTVQMILETHGEDATAVWDQCVLIQRLRAALTANRTQGPFHMDLPLTWTIFENQPQPIWAASITTTWIIPQAEWLEQD